jgi:hypothetical protein
MVEKRKERGRKSTEVEDIKKKGKKKNYSKLV